MDADLVHVVTEEFLQSTQLQSIFIIYIVVTWYYVHSDAILSQLVEEVSAVSIQCLVVDETSMFQCIAEVHDVLDVVLQQVRKEYLRVEVILVLDKDVGTISYADVCIVKYR